MIMMMRVILALVCLVLTPTVHVQAFVVPPPPSSIVVTTTNHAAAAVTTASGTTNPPRSSRGDIGRRVRIVAAATKTTNENNNNGRLLDTVVDAVQRTVRIVQQSQQEGAGVKQIMANVLAGDQYDRIAVNQAIDKAIVAAPVVLFTWAASPSCRLAIRALQLRGISSHCYKIVRLDDPWDQGHAIRAELGQRQQGKCSVPAIYINGQYIGGYDSGIGPDRPGLVDLALTGVLPERLRQAGVALVVPPAAAATTAVGQVVTTTTSSNTANNPAMTTTTKLTTTLLQEEMSTLE